MTRRKKKKILKFSGTLAALFGVGILAIAAHSSRLDIRIKAWMVYAAESHAQAQVRFNTAEKAKELADTAAERAETLAGRGSSTAEEHLPEDWNLILVNYNHPVPEDYEVELKSIGDGHRIDARIYNDVVEMIGTARRESAYVYVTSSYRDFDRQTRLHEEQIERFMEEGHPYTEAKRLAAQVVAVPGTSEHQLGLALDIVSTEYRYLDERQERTKGFQWLKEHCWEYGFILRYPNGKTEITGIMYEPWHFRYVGEEAAREIMEQGITLEEYLGAAPSGNSQRRLAFSGTSDFSGT